MRAAFAWRRSRSVHGQASKDARTHAGEKRNGAWETYGTRALWRQAMCTTTYFRGSLPKKFKRQKIAGGNVRREETEDKNAPCILPRERCIMRVNNQTSKAARLEISTGRPALSLCLSVSFLSLSLCLFVSTLTSRDVQRGEIADPGVTGVRSKPQQSLHHRRVAQRHRHHQRRHSPEALVWRAHTHVRKMQGKKKPEGKRGRGT